MQDAGVSEICGALTALRALDISYCWYVPLLPLPPCQGSRIARDSSTGGACFLALT